MLPKTKCKMAVWTDPNEIALLRAAIWFRDERGFVLGWGNMVQFFNFVERFLSIQIDDPEQICSKLKHLHRKYLDHKRRCPATSVGANEPTIYKLAAQLWFSQMETSAEKQDDANPSTALSHQVGDKFHEAFQLEHGHYSDHSAAKISEMMKSNSFENATTLSLFSVIKGILDESIDRKNGEMPHHVALILRKVVQEIERRVAPQAEYHRNQNNLIKAQEEKNQSIRVLETLANGTNEETQIIMNQIKLMKIEKSKVEEKMKLREQDIVRLMKKNENKDQTIAELKQELEMTNKMYEHHCQQLESKAHIFQNFIGFQLQSIQDLRRASQSIKYEVMNSQERGSEEISNMVNVVRNPY